MDIHFIGIIGSLVSSVMNTASGSFSGLYNWIRIAVLENISPGMAVLFWVAIILPPAVWFLLQPRSNKRLPGRDHRRG